MNIKLRNDLRIRRLDERNIIIEQDVESKRKETGEKYISQKVLGYFPTVEQALKTVIDRGYLESEVSTLEEYINDIMRVKDDLNREVASEHEI